MEFDALIICDAVTVREGLIHILGGGITRLWRATLPAPAAIMVAAVLELERDEITVPHELVVTVTSTVAGDTVINAVGGFQGQGPAKLEPDETQLFTMPFDFRQAGLMTYGRHDLTASVDGGVATLSKAFWLLHPDELGLPALEL
jgi:hypothetical protein